MEDNTLKNFILVAINDSVNSRAVLDYLINMSLCPEDTYLTLLHVFRKPTSGEELMGERFMKELPIRYEKVLNDAKERLISGGFRPDYIDIKLVTEPYQTVADGIIDQFKKGKFTLVVIGRKRMSKAEEFVLGDPSVKLIRALEGTGILVVKTL
ncbi:MAG: universal stress protein [Desulfobacterales bacterium]|nr:universal stress protein [Desulfobacterales bacterium]